MQRVQGRQLGLRLFLEGIEVDITAAKVSCGVNQPASATLTIPAVDEAHGLLPRTLVHLFYFDSRYELGTQYGKNGDVVYPGAQVRHSSADEIAKAKNEGKAALLTDKNDLHNWKLLFTGEVLGYSFRKIGGRREVVLACQDFTSYWDNCRLYWGKRKSSVFNSYKTAIFSGATQLYRGKSKVDSSGDLNRLLQKKPSVMPNVPGLLGGIFSVLESATGCYSPDAKKKFRGVNDFLSQAEIRLKLTRQIGASEKDDTSAAFTNSRSFKRYLRKVSRSTGSTATFMQFTNMLMGKIYHVWNSQTAPPYVDDGVMIWSEVRVPSGTKYGSNTEIGGLINAVKVTSDMGNRHASVGNARREGSNKLPFNKDNVKFKESKVDVKTHKEFDTVNTNKGVLSPKIGADSKVVKNLDQGALRVKGRKIYEKMLDQAGTNKAKIRQANQVLELYNMAEEMRNTCAKMKSRQVDGTQGNAAPNYDEKKSGKVASTLLHDQDKYWEIRRKAEEFMKKASRFMGVPYTTKKVKIPLRDRLLTTYFHPDLFMAPPPKCNVIFPDQVQSIQFSRNWMSEISRLWLHGRTASGRNKKDCYFSPNAQMTNGPSNEDCLGAVKKGASFIMNHEKYTGIIPTIVGLGDNDIFKKIHKKEIKKLKKEAKEKGEAFDPANVVGEAKYSPQPHLQRAANYMFFAQRYATRTVRVTLRYSPQLVAGMPALVLDPIRAKSRIMAYSGEGSTKHPDDANVARYQGMVEPKREQYPDSASFAEAMKMYEASKYDISAKPLGTHYIGVIAEIYHVLDISGGAQTVVTLAKCREHNEGADIFGNPDKDGKVSATRKKTSWSWRTIKPPKGQDTDYAPITKLDGSLGEGKTVAATSPEDAQVILGTRWSKGTRYRIVPEKDSTGGYKKATMPGSVDVQDGYQVPIQESRMDGSHLNAVEVKVQRLRKHVTTHKVKFSWEATVTPPWFSNIYTPSKIGKEFYLPMYGCGSVLDDPPIQVANRADVKKMNVNPTTGVETQDDTGVAVVQLPFAVGAGEEYREIRIPAEYVDPSATTAQAADSLADIWLGLKEIEASTDLFIDAYNSRSYADIIQVMGNQNPSLILKRYPGGVVHDGQTDKNVAVRGFHGDAYGDYKNLKKGFPDAEKDDDLVPDRLTKISDPKGVKPRKISGDIDPRSERYARVLFYVNAVRDQGFKNNDGNY